jgi:hypothetical protein
MSVLLCQHLEKFDCSHEMCDSHSSVAEDSSVLGWEGVVGHCDPLKHWETIEDTVSLPRNA